MNRTPALLFIVLALTCMHAAAYYQCPTFWVDYNQNGDYFQMCRSGGVSSYYNNQVSSFYVPPGYYVKLYQDYGYGGQSVGWYGQGYYNVPNYFNNQMSSVYIRRRGY